jgi:uncharacterized protein (TIGR04255 family)
MRQTPVSAPVYFVLAQVRFNPILKLESYIGAIQESLRYNYPDFQRVAAMTMTLVIAAGGAGNAVPSQSSPENRYLLSNMDRTAGFSLDTASLTFQTTDYPGFPGFSQAFLEGLAAVNEAVGLNFVERVGIRYLNAVYPGPGEALDAYLIPEVLGLSGKWPGTLAHAFSEMRGQNGADHTVVARTLIHDGPVGFPPDLANAQFKVAERFESLQGRHAILDIDAAASKRLVFGASHVASQLDALHDTAKEAFLALVTHHARQAWQL